MLLYLFISVAAYDYWKDMWANRQKPPKPRKPHRLPVYLEPEQQQQILAAAAAAGVPEELIQVRIVI